MKEILKEEWLCHMLDAAIDSRVKQLETKFAEWDEFRELTSIKLSILDYGAGFDPSNPNCSAGIGLASMRERLRAIHGSLVVKTSVGRGTEVVAKVKYAPKQAS